MENKAQKVKLRNCNERDCVDLWSWRNDIQVRNACFSPDVIPIGEHEKWFSSKLGNAATKIYIACDEVLDKKIGVVRFEKENRHAEININLNPEFIGKGLGVNIIKAATERYISEVGAIPIIAKIKKDNIRSQKAFEKSGYVLLEDIVEKNEKAILFGYEKTKK